MSFKTEYHVDVSFLHDLTTSAPPRERMPREEYLKYKKRLSLEYKKGEKEMKETLKKEMLRKLESLSELSKQCVEKPPSETLESSDEKQSLTGDMKNSFLKEAMKCKTPSHHDMFVKMWKLLDYDNKIKVQEYLYTNASLKSNPINPNIISEALFKYIDQDVFETLQNLLIKDFHSGMFTDKYKQKLSFLARNCTLREDDQFMKIWKKLNHDAKYSLTLYFEDNRDISDELKQWMQSDYKKSAEESEKRSREQILKWAGK